MDNNDERVAAEGTVALDNPGNQEIPVVGQQDSVYLGETLLPVPHRLVVRIRRGDYVCGHGKAVARVLVPGEESSRAEK